MNEISKHRCRPRSSIRRPGTGIPFGAGSGGDAGDASAVDVFEGTRRVVASRIEFAAVALGGPDIGVEEPHVISLFAPGEGEDGRVEMHGTKNIYLSVGPPNLPPASDPEFLGAQIAVGEEQQIVFARGLEPGMDQKISMLPGAIKIDGGEGPVTITSLSEITLQVAGGVSTISITPEGIIIQGPMVLIN